MPIYGKWDAPPESIQNWIEVFKFVPAPVVEKNAPRAAATATLSHAAGSPRRSAGGPGQSAGGPRRTRVAPGEARVAPIALLSGRPIRKRSLVTPENLSCLRHISVRFRTGDMAARSA